MRRKSFLTGSIAVLTVALMIGGSSSASAGAVMTGTIQLDKTVSLDGNCAGNSFEQIAIANSGQVTYCYKVTNMGPGTLTSHTLYDSVLMNIPAAGNVGYVLPGGTAYVTSTANATCLTSTVNIPNVATWTSVMSFGMYYGTSMVSDTDKAYVKCDSDGDGIANGSDPNEGEVDPTGCFYDEATGQVRGGGLVSVTGPGAVLQTDGSSGCYNFIVEDGELNGPQTYVVTIEQVPTGCQLSTTCTVGGPIDATGPLDPRCQESPGPAATCTLGDSGLDGDVLPPTCAANPFVDTFILEAGDPDVLNSNIPLTCGLPAPAPTMSWTGMAIAVILMIGSGLVAMRRRDVA
jgi:hypothetical protein